MKYLIDASTIITNLIQQRPIYNLLINSFGSQNSFDPTPMFFNYVVKKKNQPANLILIEMILRQVIVSYTAEYLNNEYTN